MLILTRATWCNIPEKEILQTAIQFSAIYMSVTISEVGPYSYPYSVATVGKKYNLQLRFI
jgi:hypothetical protein